jgi:hypothetical protein
LRWGYRNCSSVAVEIRRRRTFVRAPGLGPRLKLLLRCCRSCGGRGGAGGGRPERIYRTTPWGQAPRSTGFANQPSSASGSSSHRRRRGGRSTTKTPSSAAAASGERCAARPHIRPIVVARGDKGEREIVGGGWRRIAASTASCSAAAGAGAEFDPPTSGAAGNAAGIVKSSGVTWNIVKSARTNNERAL